MNTDRVLEKQASASNRRWMDVAESGHQGLEKLSELHSSQLAGYLKEKAVLDKALPPEDISPSDCEVGPTTDTLYYRIHLQTETRAFLSTFEAMPREVQEIYVPRVFVSFLMLSTPKYVANDYNIMAYPFPVTKQVEDQIGLDMHEAKDWVMLRDLEAAIQASRADYGNVLRGVEAQADIEANGTNTRFRGKLRREDMINLKAKYPGERGRIERIIVPETDYIQLERFKDDDFGDGLLSDVFVNGLESEKVHGVAIIRTIKIDNRRGDVFRTGNIYAFANHTMIGRNFNLRGLKFYIERDHQYLFFDAQMAFGFIWAVASRCVKLELYNGGTVFGTAGTLAPGNDYAGVPWVANPAVTNSQTAEDQGLIASDQLWGAPEQVTQKDYFDVSKGYRRPRISFY